jgi:hypothetical protein
MIDDKNVFYGIALRESGLFDIYWNMTLVDSPSECKFLSFHIYIPSFSWNKATNIEHATDVSCSFDELFFRMNNGKIKTLRTYAGVHFE